MQQISVELEAAREDLQEAEYDKYLSDQTALLDELMLQYEQTLNTRLDNIDYLLEQVIDSINLASSADGTIATALGSEGALAIAVSNNATSINGTLTSEANKVGVTLSSAMKDIWNGGDGNAKSVLTMYGEDFKAKSATIITTLNGINVSVNKMISYLNKDAEKKTEAPKTKPSSVANPTKSNNNNKANNNQNKKQDKQKATDDQLMGIAASIWVYGSGSGWGNDPVRSGKVAEKFDASTAKKVQSLINKHGSNGDLYNFWLKKGKNLDKYKYNAFKFGAKDISETQLAWTQENGREFIVRPSDGAILTPVAKGDSVLTSVASSNIWSMANNPAEFIRDNLKLDASNVPNASSVNNSVVQNFENITFSMPNVHGYNELLTEMQRDPKFEKLILAMTLDQIAGKSKLTKGKSIR